MDNKLPQKNENNPPGMLSRLMDTLMGIGLGETMFRAGTTMLSVVLLGVVIWLVQLFYTRQPEAENVANALEMVPTAVSGIDDLPQQDVEMFGGIPRLAQVHTTIPSRPRQEVVKYTVQEGDTVFGIAEKFGLQPETILWGNYYILLDDPHALQPGQELNILPVNGTYHEWQQGEGLNGISSYYGVSPEDIINYPANNLDITTVGDFSNPNIEPGTWLIVPHGRREFVSWSAPLGVTR
ncbi:MAG TPA: LysM peptidoglycan-binding domain-containing protein, partial [Anaerolineales bacterium]